MTIENRAHASMEQDPVEMTGEPHLTFLDIAERYLRRANKPMSAREIVALATREGVLRSSGKTPWQTMKSKLSTDILKFGTESRFKRTYQGIFSLRESTSQEYHATRFTKNKLDEQIAVIDRRDLTRLIDATGFTRKQIDRGELTRLAMPMLRRKAEEDCSVVQLVSVFVVVHQGAYLTHMRSARLPESRLRGEYSMMLGGHLSTEDFAQLTLDLFSDDEDLADCTYILRELSEELVLSTDPVVSPRGYIYDDRREVSSQHLGLVYRVDIPTPDFEIGERGFLLNARMEGIDCIRCRRAEFENWSWILMDNVELL